jgi:transcription factor CON7
MLPLTIPQQITPSSTHYPSSLAIPRRQFFTHSDNNIDDDTLSPLSPHPPNYHYLHNDSPSPVDLHTHNSLPLPLSAPHSQHSFPVQNHYRSLRNVSLLDHRRMSEPALFGNSYASPTTDAAAARYHQFHYAFSSRSNSLHRGVSTGSLRDLHNSHQYHYPDWKSDDLDSFNSTDEPISPMDNPELGMPGITYSPINQDPYGPSPPGSATSTSSATPFTVNLSRVSDQSRVNHSRPPERGHRTQSGPNSKTYSFVSLPGNAVKKRPRRRYDEIERLYQCSWPECTKAYGTLNHLNAHVTMQKHGQKRNPNGQSFLSFALCSHPNFLSFFSFF